MEKKYNLAELRCYKKNSSGIEVGPSLSYVFVEKFGDIYSHNYENVFKDEIYPLVKKQRLGENDYYYFEDNVSDVFNKYGEVGLCYVLTDVSIKNLPLEDLENIVIYSNYYFKDRADLIEERFSSLDTDFRRVLFDDNMIAEENRDYIEEFNKDNGGKILIR